MTPDNHQVTALFMYFGGLLLCFVRHPQRDRWHRALGIVAAALWLGVLAIEPRSRTAIFATTTVGWLAIAHVLTFRRHQDLPGQTQ